MSGMKIIRPTIVTDAMLTSSTASETDYAAWSSATTYAVSAPGALVRVISTVTHRIYESLRATNLNYDPTNIINRSGATPWWLDIGPTNKWAMFDRKVGTSTVLASPLTLVMRPGPVSGLGLLELSGRQAVVTMRDAPAGTIIYSKTIILDGTIILSIYDWFFSEYEQLGDVVLTDLPLHYGSPELTVSVTGTASVGCGVMQVGQVIEIGDTQYGATIGIIDRTKKIDDGFGNLDILERSYSKRNSLKIITEKVRLNKIFRLLAALRATLCIYIGTEELDYEPMIVYGFYKDFSVEIAYPEFHLCNLEIEGLT